MVEIICAVVAASATIICAWIAAENKKYEASREKQDKLAAARATQRAKEARLQLQMINANGQLTVGVAMALKHGHCNGEVEAGLAAVQEANTEYTKFLEEVALDHMNEGGISK